MLTAQPQGGILTEAPRHVFLEFSEPVTPVGTGIAVWSPSSRQVAHGLLRPAPDRVSVEVDVSDPGTYLVVWTVIASDTHASRGSYTFSFQHSGPLPVVGALPGNDVGAVSPVGLLLQALSHWLHFAGFALAFGTIFFVVLVRADDPRSERVALAGLILLAIAEPLALLAVVLSLGGFNGQVFSDILASPSGRVFALRLGAVLLLWALLGAARQRRRPVLFGIIALGVGLAVVDGTAAHAMRGVNPAAGMLLNATHELAMAAWVGGLAALVAVRSGLGADESASHLLRFGRLAGVSVGGGLDLAAMRVDYAWIALGALGSANRITLAFRF